MTEIFHHDGLDRVADDEMGDFGLGLQLPATRPLSFDTLAESRPLLSTDEIRRIVESEEFHFGQHYFDASWTTNQNGYGSCAGYGGMSGVEKMRVMAGQDVVRLSGDYLYSLVNGGRDRGSMLDANMKAIMSRGVATKETVPLGGIYRSKYNTGAADAEAKRFRGHELYAVPDEQSMATALALRMPVVIAIHVTRSWRSFSSDNVLAECNGPGNHCEHVDDIRWDDRRGCFLYRKGTSHGVNYNRDHGGYCWTLWDDHYKVTHRYHMFYAVAGVVQDPEGTNPPSPDGDDASPAPGPETPVTLRVMSNARCGHCVRWEGAEMPKALSAGWNVEKQDAGGPVPRFRIEKGGKSKELVGYRSFSELVAEAEAMQPSPNPRATP